MENAIDEVNKGEWKFPFKCEESKQEGWALVGFYKKQTCTMRKFVLFVFLIRV